MPSPGRLNRRKPQGLTPCGFLLLSLLLNVANHGVIPIPPVIASRSEAIQACREASIAKIGRGFAQAMIFLDCFPAARNDGERATIGLLAVTPEG